MKNHLFKMELYLFRLISLTYDVGLEPAKPARDAASSDFGHYIVGQLISLHRSENHFDHF